MYMTYNHLSSAVWWISWGGGGGGAEGEDRMGRVRELDTI